jgi:hypothetical protein
MRKYLEDIVVPIDTPLLSTLEMILFHQFAFDTSQLAQFISHTPKFKTLDEGRVAILNGAFLDHTSTGKRRKARIRNVM